LKDAKRQLASSSSSKTRNWCVFSFFRTPILIEFNENMHFTPGLTPKRRVAPKALGRLKQRVRELARCVRGVSLNELIKELSRYIDGWRGYFGHCETPGVLGEVDKWIRRRIRAIVWRQWKRGRTRFKALRRLGIGKDLAAQTAGSSHGPWRISMSPALSMALPNASLAKLGLASCCPAK